MVAAQPESTASARRAPVPLPPDLPLVRAADLTREAALLPTGLPPVDAFLGGLALRRTHLLVGTRGGGVTSLLHGVLAALTPTVPALLFDPRNCFFPPAAAAAGVHLPHLFRVPVANDADLARALALALRARDAFPLVVWDAGQLPSPHRLERLRALVRASGSALLLTADAAPVVGSGADGATFVARHERWDGGRGPDGCFAGRVITVTATDHRRGRSATMPLVFRFPRPIAPLRHPTARGGETHAGTTHGGDLVSRLSPAGRRAG